MIFFGIFIYKKILFFNIFIKKNNKKLIIDHQVANIQTKIEWLPEDLKNQWNKI